MDALVGLQTALEDGIVTLTPCELHSDLAVLLDQPTDKPRFTYAFIEKNKVIAVALFVLTESGVPRVLWTLASMSRYRCFELLRADSTKMLMSPFSIVERFDVV